ncbi:MAG: enoyl-CoA hydratase [Nitrospirota bacterium]
MPNRLATAAVADRIATVTLDHPPANLLGRAVLEELDRLFLELEADDAVHVVVLTGAGRFFCAGADIKELAQIGSAQQGAEFAALGQGLLNRIEQLHKPVIAAVNGACLGGGLELAMACHIRVAAAGATLGLPETRLGLIPGFGGTQRLPRILGPSKAAELILTGESVTAEEALALGLVNRVAPAKEVIQEARMVAGLIAVKGRLAVKAALQAVRAGLDGPLAEGLRREADLFGRLCETADKKEGISAFLEKRQPRFTDR